MKVIGVTPLSPSPPLSPLQTKLGLDQFPFKFKLSNHPLNSCEQS